MKSINIEKLMGHSVGISDSYYRATEKELLDDYLKAIPLLTISSEQRLQKQIEETIEQSKNNDAAIKSQLYEKEQAITNLTEKNSLNTDAITSLSDPVAVRFPDGNFQVFARGADNKLYHIFTTDPYHFNEGSWLALGQQIPFAGDPVAVSFPNGGIEIFSRGTSNQLFHMFTTSPGHWNPDGWLALGQKLAFAGS